MKKNKKLQLTRIGIVIIIALFLLSLCFPAIQIYAKACALLVYATISYIRIEDMKKQGEDTEKTILFEVAVTLALGYLFFFM